MKFLKYIFIFLFLSVFLLGNAQKSALVVANEHPLERGIQHYNAGMYKAARVSLEEAWSKMDSNSDQKETCHFYLVLSRVKLNEKKTDKLVQEFLNTHPSKTRKNQLFFDIGNHYYDSKEPTKALQWFLQVSVEFMSTQQREAYRFKMGYAYFINKNYPKAKEYFLTLTTSKKYLNDSHYYAGYIAYLEENFEVALNHFEYLKNVDRYRKELAYYKVNIQFKQKKYEQAQNDGKKLLKNTSSREISEVSKIIGESMFYLKKYSEAIPYLKKYLGKKNQLSTNDHYFLGYAYYKTKDFKNAIGTFAKIVRGKDLVAQNAYYHLADAYLKLNKKTAALNAFKNCSELNFDRDIQEDAWYNYAKLSYDIGNPYMNVSEVLIGYIDRYPKSKNARSIHGLLLQSFIGSKDFQGALNHYKIRGLAKDAVFQKISLNRGTQLFQNAKYEQASKYFKNASLQKFDKPMQSKALYWLAESFYRLKKYSQALVYFKTFYESKEAKGTKAYKNIEYALAYNYFKLLDYDRSIIHFENFIKTKSVDVVKKNDSYVRLGDCHFISKNYWNALTSYQKVIEHKSIDADYATYQKAISYGFVERDQRKIESLISFSKKYPASSYKDDALFELANAYLKTKQNLMALATFQQLKSEHKKSLYLPKALLKIGLIYFNENQANKAITQYKYIVENYPNAKEVQQAITNARRVYIDIDKVDEYAKWVQSIGYNNVNDIDLENAMYAAAENKYLKNKWTQSIASFEKYFKNFPDGLHLLKAHFFIGQAHINSKNNEKAREHYAYVIAQKNNEYTEPSLLQLAKLSLQKNDWDRAIPLLKRLEKEANFPQNVLFAKLNLMKANYEEKGYNASIFYAQKILDTKKSNLQIESDAHLYIARSSLELQRFDKAKTAYEALEKIAKGVLKAESLYYKAYFKNKNKAYENSNQVIQELTADYASHRIWGLKGLILMAKNYDALKDAFQATYILENIVKNYEQFPDLVEEAQVILKKINSKKTNTQTQASQTDF
jgi:tetratricopeptide (TPR) repeat protein